MIMTDSEQDGARDGSNPVNDDTPDTQSDVFKEVSDAVENADPLLLHALDELQRAGMLDDDADYGDMLGKAVLELVEVFSNQGHSGMSASITLATFVQVAAFKNLTPLTSNEDEWHEPVEGLWQNKRDSAVFSKDGGVTWYSLDQAERKSTEPEPEDSKDLSAQIMRTGVDTKMATSLQVLQDRDAPAKEDQDFYYGSKG